MMENISKRTMQVMMEDSTSKTSSAQEKMLDKPTISSITEITIMSSMKIINTRMDNKIITTMISMPRTLTRRYHKSFPRMTLKMSTAKPKQCPKASRLILKIRSRQMIKTTLRARLHPCNNKE